MASGKNQYYIYSYLREDNSPYYIGKGSGRRAYTKGPKEVKPPRNKSRVRILKADLTEEEAFLLEKLYILMFGRIDLSTGILRNRSDGGDGASVGTKSGFSIITYNSGSTTGNFTVDHGLNAVPKFIIHRTRSSGNWWVYHASVIDDLAKYLQLNSTNAVATNSANMWGGAFPTSSVFGVRVGDLIGTSQNAIAYCWAEIPGFSKFGSYTGSSTTNFVNLGFKPAWVMIKNSSSSSYPTYTGWAIFDGERTPYNVVSNAIFANKSQAENLRGNGGAVTVADFSLDLLSNGFCLRDNGASEINLSGNSYIYAAFAETPSFNLYGGQANAR